MDENDLVRRACAAYFRSLKREGAMRTIPGNSSGLATHGGKDYVVLRNVNGTLAVYRVLNNGALKGLKRWPRQVEEY